MRDLVAGDRLDQYELTELLARSGMASIFKAIDERSGSKVALKVPHMQFESDLAFYQRFNREEQIGQKLEHPNIVRVLAPEQKSRMYLVMEYAEGRSLRAVIGKGPRPRSTRRCASRARSAARSCTCTRKASFTAISSRTTSSWGRREDQAARLRHLDGRVGAAPHVVRLDPADRHARLHGARAGSRQARRRRGPTSTPWAPSSTRWSRARCRTWRGTSTS
jgi:hypothetical protein